MILALLCIFQVASASGAATLNPYGVLTDNPYVVNRFMEDGKWIDEVIVPGRPPEIYRAQAAIIPEPNVAAGTNTLPNVPAFDWSYGCSATSAAMMFGYYDNIGYPNIYTGPTNGGVKITLAFSDGTVNVYWEDTIKTKPAKNKKPK